MIRQLPQELINKIAAGEVVERPSSVVKELVENSIDAHASGISVIIDSEQIKVIDNGVGMSEKDLKKLFVNHSTSKISKITDLDSISTLGFRGEAISTIESVSKMEIMSKQKNSRNGFAKNNEENFQSISMNDGTVVTVRNLFFNVPARKKFMKSEAVENKHIMDTFTRLALANSNISFQLLIKDKVIFNLQSGTLAERIKNLMPNVKFTEVMKDDVLSGFISDPRNSFAKPTYQYFFVNNRFITSSPMISRAIFNGYKNSLMRGQYPPYVIFLNVKPDEVDVNVHPRKTDVKFANEGYIFQKIYSLIQHSLFNAEEKVQRFNLEMTTPETNIYGEALAKSNNEDSTKYKVEEKSGQYSFAKEISDRETFSSVKKPLFSRAMKFSSELMSLRDSPLETVNTQTAKQYLNSYIIAENQEGLIIFDQHACSERFLFEKYRKRTKEIIVRSRKLLISEEVPLEFAELLFENKSLLTTFGIDVEEIDGKTMITGIPEFSKLKIIDQLYADLKSIFENDFSSISDLQEKMYTTLACHSAIRFGDKLSDIECRRILEDLISCENKLTCPHGRPTYQIFSEGKLLEIFKRA